MNDDSATAKLVHRAIEQYGKNQPSIKEHYMISAVAGLAGTNLSVDQIKTRAIAIAEAMTNGRAPADRADR